MNNIVFATNNAHKIEEIRQQLGQRYTFLSLNDIGCTVELPETSDTIVGNALQKARYVFEHFHCNCFAEDTGLEVFALDGEPGVYTGRYAGPARDATANSQKLLDNLLPHADRSAQFRTVIALILDGKEYVFEGIVKGRIATEFRGEAGFGYDPVFIPDGYEQTFAELGMDIKNSISHRARAVVQLRDFLQTTAP